MMNKYQKEKEAFGRLLEVMDDLREKCPWDSKQTMDSLRSLTIEEVYELTEAIIEKDIPNIKKELGDVLLHIVFYAKIASETKDFDITDVIHSLCDKLIHRHPHIYATTKANTAGDVERNWEQIKLKEKNGNKSVLSGVPSTLPALIKSYRIQDKARNVGFDWEKREQVWEKVKEEINEVQTEIESQNQDLLENEFGDLLFSIINVARHYNVDPETALEQTNQKFIKRFNYLENKTIKQGKNLKEMTLAEMDEIWNEAK
ncbi:MAG: nucleoside triphosphate pyrophosphohydrolase, partial [Paludibacteraceae bacterium]|nr:nucleoside triphosphate pyrophosphohydrolase [Paludibacteraceae bacterium]